MGASWTKCSNTFCKLLAVRQSNYLRWWWLAKALHKVTGSLLTSRGSRIAEHAIGLEDQQAQHKSLHVESFLKIVVGVSDCITLEPLHEHRKGT